MTAGIGPAWGLLQLDFWQNRLRIAYCVLRIASWKVANSFHHPGLAGHDSTGPVPADRKHRYRPLVLPRRREPRLGSRIRGETRLQRGPRDRRSGQKATGQLIPSIDPGSGRQEPLPHDVAPIVDRRSKPNRASLGEATPTTTQISQGSRRQSPGVNQRTPTLKFRSGRPLRQPVGQGLRPHRSRIR